MGKQGPCHHCGVTRTPLWRNGPAEKPVLCNACGSRWRTKGSLANYTPLHARAEPEENDDHRAQRLRTMSVNTKNSPAFNHGFKKVTEEDDNCVLFESADGSELTGAAESMVWDACVPCKRRTCVGRPKSSSSVEKLRKDLYSILQEQQSWCLSGSSEEELLWESGTPMVSVEIGHGSVLMRHPHSIARQEESEGSSLSVDNKSSSANEAYSQSVNFGGHPIQMTTSQTERLQFLASRSSPLCSIDLKDVVNFDEFMGQFTDDEQQHLMKLLPQIDSLDFPDSLRSMFESSQFKENLSFFQKLVADGGFDKSSALAEDYKMLMKLALSDLTISHLVESYNQLKDRIQNQNASIDLIAVKRIISER